MSHSLCVISLACYLSLLDDKSEISKLPEINIIIGAQWLAGISHSPISMYGTVE